MDDPLLRGESSGDHSYSQSLTGDSPRHSGVVLRETPQKNKLHVAAKLKQVEDAKNVIAEDSSLLHQTNSKHDTSLHIAARVGCLKMAQLLIESAKKDQDVEANKKLLRMVNIRKDTALHDAVRNGHFDIVKLLIYEDSHLASLENGDGESALFLAVDRKYFDIADQILQKGPCSYRGRNGMNVMHAAVIRTTEDYSFTNICNAILKMYNICVAGLLFNPNFRNAFFSYPGFWKSEETMKSALMEEVMKNCPSTILEEADDEFGWIPLHYAAHLGHMEAVEFFLKYDNNSLAYIQDKKGMSALHIAAREGHVDVMKELIETCLELDASELLDHEGRTALHVAAESGKVDVVKYILNKQDFVLTFNEQDKEGNTPLMLAGGNGHYEIVCLLADVGVDRGAVNKNGQTAIDIILLNTKIPSVQKVKLANMLDWIGGLAMARVKGVINTETIETEKQTVKAEPEETNNKGDAKPFQNKLKEIAKFDILAVTIIASVTFAAGFTIPGGYEVDGDLKGMAVLANKRAFRYFMIFDALAFFCSATAILLHFFSTLPIDATAFSSEMILTASALTYISILTMMAAFVVGTTVVLPESEFFTHLIPWLFWIVLLTGIILPSGSLFVQCWKGLPSSAQKLTSSS